MVDHLLEIVGQLWLARDLISERDEHAQGFMKFSCMRLEIALGRFNFTPCCGSEPSGVAKTPP